MLVVQQLPCSAKRAASQPVLSKLFLRAQERLRDNCPMLSLLLIFLVFFFSPPPKQPPPVYYCCSREANGAFCFGCFARTVWFYDRCVGAAFS